MPGLAEFRLKADNIHKALILPVPYRLSLKIPVVHHASLEKALDSMNFSYGTQMATRSAFLEDQRFSSETVCKKCATNYVAQAYEKAEGLLDRELDKMLLDYEEQITDTISELEVLLDACRSPENAETIAQISELLDVNVVLQAVEEVHSERKASASLEPLQSYLDQIYYEENKLTETCEDNPFLKQLGKLFRYYGYQARSVIDQIRSDGFILSFILSTTLRRALRSSYRSFFCASKEESFGNASSSVIHLGLPI